MKNDRYVYIASDSIIKTAAVHEALRSLGWHNEVISIANTSSGANAQPYGAEETELGARNRLLQLHPFNAVQVSIENGIDEAGNDFACILIRDPDTGIILQGTSERVRFPEEDIKRARERGFATTTVGQVLSERTGCNPKDPHRYLTEGKTSRQQLLEETLVPLFECLMNLEKGTSPGIKKACNGTTITLPIRPMNESLAVAVYEPHRSVGFTRQAAKELAARLVMSGGEIILTPEGKGGGLVFALAEELGIPYEVARKSAKSYMLKPIVKSVRDECMTDNDNVQDFFLDAASVQNLQGRRVILFDDVISTGGSIEALKQLCQQIGVQVVVVSCVFTEGTRHPHVISLNHLPLFKP